ncbi:aminotransferase class I/II-fold pyridoxal phosphate-dependent enzyme [Bacteroidales bacterium OttesenSCG-928-K22]|nr:aminotransferase class I/II-fold pyridoxal phosphate-dependent enzyme [Bacteroidales bacterium OttesenSCG-928-K22]
MKKKQGFNTKLIHGGLHDESMGSAVMPIYQTSTFRFNDADHGAALFAGEGEGYIYSRLGNPTIEDLERTMAELENGYGGISAASGMGAVNVVYFALLEKGAHVLSHNAIYGAARSIMENFYSKYGVEYTYIDMSDINNVIKNIKPNTKLIYTETPANPTMDVTDLEALCKIAKEKGIAVCVDNTFCSPYLQNPIDFGADIVLHSMTKSINGHADIVAGMLVAKDEAMYKRLRTVMTNIGCNMDPTQAFMVRRGLKTLSLRIEKAQENAQKVAEFLDAHPKVKWVKYPGLKSFPQYELAQKQMRGSGSMMAFELKDGLKAGKILMDNVQLCLLAVSLGGIETLIQHPASMTHSKVSKEKQIEAGITEGLVRLSVGIENAEDIIADLDNALSKI